MHRVAITGVGAISCLGTSRENIAQGLYEGRSGIVLDPERVRLGFRSPLTGRIEGFDPSEHVNRKTRKTMTEHAVQAYAAALQAIEQAGIDPAVLENEHSGVVFGCDSSCIAGVEQVELTRTHQSTGAINSGYVFRAMTSNVTMNLSTLLKTKGAAWTISAACSSGGHAVGQAADLIRLGRQERVLCGGAQELNWESISSFDAIEAFSMRVASPESASRPFSADRDGLVPSGGAAAILLERYDLAQARGARILGEVLGYGFSSDGGKISVPDQDGLCRAMRMALRGADTPPGDIDYVCAHATSTPVGDGIEASAIHDIFDGQGRPGVSSLKAMTGHELWMAGAAQVVYCTLMAERGFTAANVNFSGPDEASARLNILTSPLEQPPRKVLCNSAGFGGTNACLVLQYAV